MIWDFFCKHRYRDVPCLSLCCLLTHLSLFFPQIFALNLLPTFCTYIYRHRGRHRRRGIRVKAAPQPDLRGFWWSVLLSPFSVWDYVFAFSVWKRKLTRMVPHESWVLLTMTFSHDSTFLHSITST